ncbi:glycosyltransferase family 4 protein [Brenneria goodwinii]|uniref:glycosyltransferase family 4 protein n=1 Tax=Brenneria goodwinii TaxID=1109412 RepID=UPI0036EFCE60
MKFAFLTRVDAFDKNGGDTYQLQMYKEYLETKGHDVLIVHDLTIPQEQDFYILVNLDRPLELVIYYNKLRKENKINKMLILPIHHSYECINFFEGNIRKGFQGIILNKCSRFHQREKIKNVVRGLKYPKLIKYSLSHFFINYMNISRNILMNAIGVILIAEGEQKIIKNDFSVDIDNSFLVKNGVNLTKLISLAENKDRKIDILVCGRIEPRKNSLAIANYFKDKNYKVSFVGALNKNSKAYCEEFTQVVNESENLEYLGKVTHDELSSLYLNTKIHLSASWFEVASLVDLEAYAYGCHIISSINGHTKDYLQDRARYVDPSNFDGLGEMVFELNNSSNYLKEQYDYISSSFTWERSGKTLLSVFESLILR